MDRIKLTLLDVPMAKQSTRVASKGYKYKRGKDGKIKKVRNTWTYTDKKHTARLKNYQAQIRKQLPKDFELFKGAVVIERLIFIFPPTAELLGSKKRREAFERGMVTPKITKPDLPDNLKKLPLDALSGLVYEDDARVWQEAKTAKVFGFNPRIEMILRLQPISKEVKFLALEDL